MKNLFITISFLLFFVEASYSQDTIYFVNSPTQKIFNSSNTELTRAWSGGFRSPMFSELDANNDGENDIFVFDRFDKSITIFLYDNGEYVYAPDFDFYFPPLTGWVLLRDYNCDGKNDIFAQNFNGVQVWENTTVGDRPKFTQVTNSLMSIDGPVTVLNGDIPAIDDIDDDGDLDILTFGPTSVYVTYYKNESNNCDLDFGIYTQCWGHFAEGGLSSSITLGDSCGGNIASLPPPLPQATLHQGSTLATVDYDGDGDKDLVVGDISSNNLKLLINGGNAEKAVISQVIDNFPTSNPVDIYVYPDGFFIDVDHDGDKDFIASTAEIALSGGRNVNNAWYYENKSTTSATNFEFVRENFLMDKSIDVGGGPAPHFYDFDNDGDKDLLIGSFIEKVDAFNLEAKLYLYENIGDSTAAIFKLKDDDFANLSDTLIYGINPTTGDLDGDGDIDLLLGTNDGYLIYYQNLSPAGTFPIFDTAVYQYAGLDIGFSSAPCLVDFDRDNDLDLIIGEGNGNLNYFENIGDISTPNFSTITDTLGRVNVQNPQFPTGYGYSTPYITQLDTNNSYDLVVGSWDGIIRIYMNIDDYNIADEYPSITNTYFNSESQFYTDLDFSTRTNPALTDLNGDGLNDMIFGVFRGGFHVLFNNSDSTLTPNLDAISTVLKNEVSIFPNPTTGNINIVCNNKNIKYVYLFNTTGEQVLVSDKKNIDISQFNRGIYIVKVIFDDNTFNHQKIILN